MSKGGAIRRIEIDRETPTIEIRRLRDRVTMEGIPAVGHVGASELAGMLDELLHVREQRDALQKRGTELVMDNQRRRHDTLAKEELLRETGRLLERLVTVERVALKLFDAYDDAATILTEDECFVLEWAGAANVLGSLVESLAADEHDRWSRWEKWRTSPERTDKDKARWRKQRETVYAKLTDREKESDRKEARRILELLLNFDAVSFTSETPEEKEIRE